MNARTARLVLLLRLAYLIGAGLFALDIIVGVTAAGIQVAETGEVDEHAPIALVLDWGALTAFAFTALGAVITVVTTVRLTKDGEPGGHSGGEPGMQPGMRSGGLDADTADLAADAVRRERGHDGVGRPA